MITEELLGFIRGQYAAGMSIDEMTALLVAEGGWDTFDIEEALLAIGISSSPVIEPAPAVIENVISSTPLGVNAASTIQSTPSFEIIAPSLGSSIKDTTFHSDTDDFLGIFAQHHPLAEQKLSPTPIVATPPLETPPITPTQTNIHVFSADVPDYIPDQTPTLATEITTPPPLIPIEIPITLRTPTLVPEEPAIDLDMSPQETAEASRSFAVPPPPPPTPASPPPTPPVIIPEIKAESRPVSAPIARNAVTLDLAMLRKNLATGAATANTENANAGKIVETRSVAELWLAGARKEANSPSGAPTGGLSGVPVRPKILSRRTMSSDMLLRGIGGSVPGMPAVSVPEEAKKLHATVETASGFKAAEVKPSLPKVQPSVEATQPLVVNVTARKFLWKAIASVLIGLGVLAATAVGGWYLFTQLRGPNLSLIYGNAFQQFFGVTSFGYHGSAATKLVLSTATDGVNRSGGVEFSLDYAGLLANGINGYGDGLHQIKFKGGLHSGNFDWVTDLASDVRLIGSTLYFHVLSFPDTSNADPDLFRTYWVKFDFADIAKELALQGVNGTGEGYGDFGSGETDANFASLMQQNLPFSLGDRLPDETLPGGPAYHLALHANPDQMVTLAGILYQKYTNTPLVIDANQKLRLRDAFAKIRGEVLIDQKTNTLIRLSLKGNLDDDIVGVHVKGPLSFTFEFSDFNKSIVVEIPTPMLTLEELRVRMDDFKKVKEKRTRDLAKKSGVSEIEGALEAYRTQNGRYPTFLVDLVSAGKLSTSTMSEITLKKYFYAAYVKPDALTKSGLCSTKGKVCAHYHLGVNLEDMTNPLLGSDADQNTQLRGGDATGCGGEQDVACYDVISQVSNMPAVPSASTVVSTTTKSIP